MSGHTVTVPEELRGDALPVLSDEIVRQTAALLVQCQAVQAVDDPEGLHAAEGLFADVDDLAKRIHDERMSLTRPLDALKKAIIAEADRATEPLKEEKTRIGHAARGYRQRVEAERREAERRAREEAERRAAEERARLEAERQRQIAERQAAWEAEQRRREDEAALFGDEPAQAEEPPPPPPPPPVVEPVLEPVAAPDLGQSSIRTTKRKVLVVHDEDAIPHEVAGVRPWRLDKVALRKLLDAGVPVPGAALEVQETIGRAGR